MWADQSVFNHLFAIGSVHVPKTTIQTAPQVMYKQKGIALQVVFFP